LATVVGAHVVVVTVQHAESLARSVQAMIGDAAWILIVTVNGVKLGHTPFRRVTAIVGAQLPVVALHPRRTCADAADADIPVGAGVAVVAVSHQRRVFAPGPGGAAIRGAAIAVITVEFAGALALA